MGLDWPEPHDIRLENPAAIESHLSSLITNAHLQLLGELNFDEPAGYENTNFTIFELANFVFEKLASRSSGHQRFENYPAACAIWGVAQSQRNEESGQRLWDLAPIDSNSRVKLASAFSDSIEELGLETFYLELLGERVQRHVNLARMHAIIPSYAIEDFVEEVSKGFYRGFNPRLIHQAFLKEGKARPMSRLFEYRPDMAIDLIERSLKVLQFGIDAGLPLRILEKLKSWSFERSSKVENSISLPSINFSEYGIIYALGYEKWNLTNSKLEKIDPNDIPVQEIMATSGDFGEFKILDPELGYLLFDRNLKLSETMSKVPNHGYLIWDSKRISVNTEDFYQVPEYMSNKWPGWKFAQPWPDKPIQLTFNDGSIKVLGVKPEIRVQEFLAPNLFWSKMGVPENKKMVHFQAPVIISGVPVTCINNVDKSKRTITELNEKLVPSKVGTFSVDLYSGIGLSEHVEGALIPGIEIQGDTSSLMMGECRSLQLKSSILHDLEFQVEASPKWLNSGNAYIGIQAKTKDDKAIMFHYKPSVISWVLVSEDGSDESMEPIVKHVRDLTKVRMITIYNADEVTPTIFVHKDKLEPLAIKGVKSGSSITFDLKAIRGSVTSDSLMLQFKKGQTSVTPIEFKNYQLASSVDGGRAHINDLSKLKDFVIENKIISKTEWEEYELQRLEAASLARTFRQSRWR